MGGDFKMISLASKAERRFTPRLRILEEHEVGRPHARMRLRNIVQGQMDARVQPLYDVFQVAASTACVQVTLFTIPYGQQFTPQGGSATTKTLYHTNLLNSGSLDAPKKLLVKNISIMPRCDLAPLDNDALCGQYVVQFTTLGKQFWVGHAQKCPGGAGAFVSGTFAQSAAASATAFSAANGWPSGQNVAPITDPVPDIPGYPPITPITGVLLEQGQPFQVIVDPTLTGATVYSTGSAIAGVPANGIIAWCYLEGITLVAIV
jgi:hypothetical protein